MANEASVIPTGPRAMQSLSIKGRAQEPGGLPKAQSIMRIATHSPLRPAATPELGAISVAPGERDRRRIVRPLAPERGAAVSTSDIGDGGSETAPTADVPGKGEAPEGEVRGGRIKIRRPTARYEKKTAIVLEEGLPDSKSDRSPRTGHHHRDFRSERRSPERTEHRESRRRTSSRNDAERSSEREEERREKPRSRSPSRDRARTDRQEEKGRDGDRERRDRRDPDRRRSSLKEEPKRHRDSHSHHHRRRSRSISDSESEDSEEERRRRKKRKEKERRREEEDREERRRARKEKERRDDEREREKTKKPRTISVSGSYGKYGVLTITDQARMANEFRAWLVEQRRLVPDAMSRDKLNKEFAVYIDDFNNATLPHEKYYNMSHHQARMAALRNGEKVVSEIPQYDPRADEKAHVARLRATHLPDQADLTREEIVELRRLEKERVEAVKRRQLGLEVPKGLGVRTIEVPLESWKDPNQF